MVACEAVSKHIFTKINAVYEIKHEIYCFCTVFYWVDVQTVIKFTYQNHILCKAKCLNFLGIKVVFATGKCISCQTFNVNA